MSRPILVFRLRSPLPPNALPSRPSLVHARRLRRVWTEAQADRLLADVADACPSKESDLCLYSEEGGSVNVRPAKEADRV